MAAVATPPESPDLRLKSLKAVVEAPHTIHKQFNLVISYENVVQSSEEKQYAQFELSYVGSTKVDGIPTIEVSDSIIDTGKARWMHTIVGYV